MTWHIPEHTVRAYVDDRIAAADAWSVETHLIACERCRQLLAEAAADTEAAATTGQAWAAIASRLPQQGRVRPGARRRELRVLISSGPAARGAWLLAVAAVLVLAMVLDTSRSVSTGLMPGTPLLAIVAPVLPVLGVAVSYGSGLDDAYEVIASTPGGGLRLLFVRTVSVLVATVPAALAAGAVTGYGTPIWLLPCLTLTLLTLAVGSLVGIGRAAAGVGVAWVVAVAATSFDRGVPAVLAAGATPAWLLVATAGVAVVAARRESYNQLSLPMQTRIEA